MLAYVQDKSRNVRKGDVAMRTDAPTLVIVANVSIQIPFGPVLPRAQLAYEVTIDVLPQYALNVSGERIFYPVTVAPHHRCELAHQ